MSSLCIRTDQTVCEGALPATQAWLLCFLAGEVEPLISPGGTTIAFYLYVTGNVNVRIRCRGWSTWVLSGFPSYFAPLMCQAFCPPSSHI